MGNLTPGEKYEYINENGKVYAVDVHGVKHLVGEIVYLNEDKDERETNAGGCTNCD